MTGLRFGMLTVESRADRQGRGGARWNVRCDCGVTKSVTGGNLRSGSTISCGCKRINALRLGLLNRLDDAEACARIAVHDVKKSAAQRGLEWGLSDEDVRVLLVGRCAYCGCAPSTEHRLPNRDRVVMLRNGIDRVNNDRGYTIDNVVSCCKQCNYAKRNQTLVEFTEWVERITSHRMAA